MDTDFSELEERIRYRFRDGDLLRRAFIHPSFAAEQDPMPEANQRLEFLGDAVMQFVVAEELYRRFPEFDEGKLTKLRSALTKDKSLVDYARSLGIGEFLLLGKGEARGGGAARPSNLEDAFEALLGAAYLDGGSEAVAEICRRIVFESMPHPDALLARENPKGALQEHTQEHLKCAPAYEVLNVTGPEHKPEFEVCVRLKDRELARARAGSRREAERRAARLALEVLVREVAGDE